LGSFRETKEEDSTGKKLTTGDFIQAIEIEPAASFGLENLKQEAADLIKEEGGEPLQSPFRFLFDKLKHDPLLSPFENKVSAAADFKLKMSSMINFKPAKKQAPIPISGDQEFEDDEIFITGFDRRRTDEEDMWNYFEGKFGKIKDLHWPMLPDKSGKKQRHAAYMFVKFEERQSAFDAVNYPISMMG